MFRINLRTDYAVRIMLGLAASETTMKAADLSLQAGVPAAFVHKVIQDLVRGGLVWTSAGPEGGASLARPANAITLLHIVETMEGPMRLNLCLIGSDICERQPTCPAHPVWERIQMMIGQELAGVTLASLEEEGQRLAERVTGSAG